MSRSPNHRSAGRRGHGARLETGSLVAITAILLACGPAVDRPPDASARATDGSHAPTAGSGAVSPPVDSALPDREDFVTSGLRDYGTTRSSIAQALGEPDSVAFEVVPNRHVPEQQDTLFTVFYDGLVAHVHRPGPGGEMLSRMDVTDNRHLRAPVIGRSRDAVTAAFGAPDEEDADSMTWYCTSCIAGNDPVELQFGDGRVTRVTFSYYVD